MNLRDFPASLHFILPFFLYLYLVFLFIDLIFIFKTCQFQAFVLAFYFALSSARDIIKNLPIGSFFTSSFGNCRIN